MRMINAKANRIFLFLLTFMLSMSLLGVVVFGDAWLDDRFQKRIVFEISNTGSIQTECPVRFDADTEYLIQQEGMLEDGRDIRFAGSDGVTLLPFSLLSGINTPNTQFGVRMDSIPTGTSYIYMYFDYVCESIASASDAQYWYYSNTIEGSPIVSSEDSHTKVYLKTTSAATQRFSPMFNALNVNSFDFSIDALDGGEPAHLATYDIWITSGASIFTKEWVGSGGGSTNDPWHEDAYYDASPLTAHHEINFRLSVTGFSYYDIIDIVTVTLANDPSISTMAWNQEDCPNPITTETFYVKVDGNDGVDGKSYANAWATLNHAFANMSADNGNILRIDEGTYNGFEGGIPPLRCTNLVGGYWDGSWHDWTEGSGYNRPVIISQGGELSHDDVSLKYLEIDASANLMFASSGMGYTYRLVNCIYQGMIWAGDSIVTFINTDSILHQATSTILPTGVTPEHHIFVVQSPNAFNEFTPRKAKITPNDDIDVTIEIWDLTGDHNKQLKVEATGDRTITFQLGDMLANQGYDLKADGVKESSAKADASGIITFPAYSGSFGGGEKIFTTELTPLIITIESPLAQNYTISSIWFNATVNLNADWCGYSLDGAANVTMSNLLGNWSHLNSTMTEGEHNVVFCCNDTAGNENSTGVAFTIDSVSPKLTIHLPANTTYGTVNQALNYTSSDINLNTTWYEYNSTNTTLTANITFTAIEGQSTLILWANDTAGNINSTSVTFTVDMTAPNITITSPENTTSLPAGTTQAYINITTDENAVCRYNTTDSSFENSTNFTSTGGLNHSFLYAGLLDGQVYNLYYRCNDSYSNINTDSTYHTFSVSSQSTYCGDGTCSNGETCRTCPLDCGSCPGSGSWTVPQDEDGGQNMTNDTQLDIADENMTDKTVDETPTTEEQENDTSQIQQAARAKIDYVRTKIAGNHVSAEELIEKAEISFGNGNYSDAYDLAVKAEDMLTRTAIIPETPPGTGQSPLAYLFVLILLISSLVIYIFSGKRRLEALHKDRISAQVHILASGQSPAPSVASGVSANISPISKKQFQTGNLKNKRTKGMQVSINESSPGTFESIRQEKNRVSDSLKKHIIEMNKIIGNLKDDLKDIKKAKGKHREHKDKK